MADDTDPGDVARLRASAHPVRLRIMSLLTAEALSAAEVARALDLTHANASYHLRVLHDVGVLVVESEEKIRGGVAKRYRYDASRQVSTKRPGLDARIAYARANALEIDAFLPKAERRLLAAALNTLLASPTFASWRQGATLDVGEWLNPPGVVPVEADGVVPDLSSTGAGVGVVWQPARATATSAARTIFSPAWR